MTQRPDIVPLRGGLDLVTPPMLVAPGFLTAAQNYEVEARGYRRTEGFERLDGQPAPSEAAYYVLPFDQGTTAVSEGDVVTGLTSGATGTALVAGLLTAGTYGGSDARGNLVLHSVSGSFVEDEALQVSAATVAFCAGAILENGIASATDHATYLASVTQLRRDAIAKPPGSGPVRGVFTLAGAIYAMRDDAAGTYGIMHKATTAGWVAQSFGRILHFDQGEVSFVADEVVTGATSGATGRIERLVHNDGSWSGPGGDAEGYLILSNVAGAFTPDETITSDTGEAITVDTDQAITLPPGGHYRAIEYNFYGQAETTRLYVANGVGFAFEWDGTVLAPIKTGIAVALDKPKFVAVHREHLFLGYEGGSLIYSAPGEPLVIDALQGAGEIAFGHDLTGLASATQDALIITARNAIGYLVGASSGSFDPRKLTLSSGAIEDTLQIVGRPVFMDDQGVRDMQAAEVFGDWKMGTMTRLIEPLLARKRTVGATPRGAIRVRAKDQYRLYYDDGTGIVIYFGRRDPECMAIAPGFVPWCMTSAEDANGNEILLVGTDDGWVYQLDKGTSFDGTAIEAFIRTSWLNQGSPGSEKRYHRGRIEGHAQGATVAIATTAEFSYGDWTQPPAVELAATLNGGGGLWDEAYWDEFLWSAAVEGQVTIDLDGLGENVSIAVVSDTATEPAHTLSVLTVHWTRRRMLR